MRNLDVLGLVVDLLLVDLLVDPGRLHFDSVDDVFVHGVRQLSVDFRFREPAPLPCKFPSVGLHLVAVSIGTCLPNARLSQDLVCRVLLSEGLKDVDLGESPSFLDHVYLGCTQRECTISMIL